MSCDKANESLDWFFYQKRKPHTTDKYPEYYISDENGNEERINFCPFCGSELDKNGCTAEE